MEHMRKLVLLMLLSSCVQPVEKAPCHECASVWEWVETTQYEREDYQRWLTRGPIVKKGPRVR